MKNALWAFCIYTFLASCQSNKCCDVASRKYIHKYGFELSEKEWEEREKNGQIITHLPDGTIITQNFSKGQLHGSTTYTFPHTDTIARLSLYDEGNLLKTIVYDQSGSPLQEESYTIDNKKIITVWNNKGVPLKVEEYENDRLWNGRYFNQENEQEAHIEAGEGFRINKDRDGNLLTKDKFESGLLVQRITYHPSGQMQSTCCFKDYLLHGKQQTFSPTGSLLLEANWDDGLLNGTAVMYRNGRQVLEVPYAYGKKEGIEKHYDDEGNLTAEIQWIHDQRHGSSRYYFPEDSVIEWYFHGKNVGLKKFQILEFRDQLIADLDSQ